MDNWLDTYKDYKENGLLEILPIDDGEQIRWEDTWNKEQWDGAEEMDNADAPCPLCGGPAYWDYTFGIQDWYICSVCTHKFVS